MIIATVIMVFLFAQGRLYLFEGDADLAVHVVEDDEHLVVVDIDAVQKHIDQPLLLLYVIKVGGFEFTHPKVDLLLG